MESYAYSPDILDKDTETSSMARATEMRQRGHNSLTRKASLLLIFAFSNGVPILQLFSVD